MDVAGMLAHVRAFLAEGAAPRECRPQWGGRLAWLIHMRMTCADSGRARPEQRRDEERGAGRAAPKGTAADLRGGQPHAKVAAGILEW